MKEMCPGTPSRYPRCSLSCQHLQAAPSSGKLSLGGGGRRVVNEGQQHMTISLGWSEHRPVWQWRGLGEKEASGSGPKHPGFHGSVPGRWTGHRALEA